MTQAGPIAAPTPVPTAPIDGIRQGYWLYAATAVSSPSVRRSSTDPKGVFI